jgi:hypothetical protein
LRAHNAAELVAAARVRFDRGRHLCLDESRGTRD